MVALREQPDSISEGFPNLSNSLIPCYWEFKAEFAPEPQAQLIQGEQEWEQTWDEALEGLPWTFVDPQEVSVAVPAPPKSHFFLGTHGLCNSPELCSSGAGRVKFIP